VPFWGDQAIFTIYGRELTRGAVLYRDVFDLKQPGIFWFYALGGRVFGFTEVGLHIFELVYWLAFSAFALVALRPYFSTRWGAPLVPMFTVAVYYLYAQQLDLGQIEMLVAFPILLAWWLIDRASTETPEGVRRYALAGLVTAGVFLFKYLYTLIVLGFLVYAVVRSRRDGTSLRDLRRSLIAFLVALLLPLLLLTVYFAVYGQLGRIWWAYFELAPKTGEKAFSEGVLGARRFLIGHGPIIILAVLGCSNVLWDRARPKLDLVVGMLLWISIGAVAVIIQNWFEYKWLLFNVPLGILAATGLERFVAIAGNRRRTTGMLGLAAAAVLGIIALRVGVGAPHIQTLLLLAIAIGASAAVAAEVFRAHLPLRHTMTGVISVGLVVSLALAAIGPIDKIRLLAKHDFALTAQARTDLWRSSSAFYRDADQDLDALGKRLPPGPLEVIGSPMLLLRGNRPPANPFLAVRPEFFDQRAWRELYSQLRSTRPLYIVVDDYLGNVIRRRYPAIMEFIESRYEVALLGATGTWYLRRDSTADGVAG
jgi:hypothetical protein